jgi:hypothetical protein
MAVPLHHITPLDDAAGEQALRDMPSLGRLLLYTAALESVSLENFYAGRSAFLLCGGPSLKHADLSQLRRRGIVTMAVNNAWTVYRPNLWVSVDSPGHFHDVGWRDPGITKFVPLANLGKTIRRKRDGVLEDTGELVRDMPAVFGFRRRLGFAAPEFLDEAAVCWGNEKGQTDELGITASRSVMLAAVRILVYLGFSRIYLSGCDFKMEVGRQNYAFEQDRTPDSVSGNNATYKALNARFAALVPYLGFRGVEIRNTTPGSGLTAFPMMDFAAAVEEAGRECSGPVDTLGWYEGPPKEEKKPEAKPEEVKV